MEQVTEKYKQTDIGLIPNDWEVKTINEAFDICNNLRLPLSETVRKQMQGEYPYYGPTKIQDYINEYRVEGEYALIGEDGDHFLKWNEMPMTQIVYGKFNVNNHAHLVKGKTNIAITKWFYHYFKNRDITRHLTRQGAGRYKLSKTALVDLLCAIPPTSQEQNNIATALNDADKLITALEKLIAKKRAIKQGAMQELLKPKDGWKVRKLGDCLRQNPDYGINAAAVPYNESLPIYLRITDITEDGKYSKKNIVSVDSTSSSAYYLHEGDLVFARTGASVGKAYLYDIRDGELVFAGFLIRIKTNPEILIPEYFQFYTQTSSYWDWIRANSMRTGQPGINGNEYKELIIYLPSKSEQTRIATILSDMDSEIEALEKKLGKYKMIKQGMMQNLLPGRIRLI